jgi:hypothetical protein
MRQRALNWREIAIMIAMAMMIVAPGLLAYLHFGA